MIVSLNDLVRHLNLPEDQDTELLTQKLEAAHTAVENATGLVFADEFTAYAPAVYEDIPQDPDPGNDGGYTTELVTPEVISDAPAPLKEAVLQYAAYLYEFRELASTGERITPLPLGTFDLIAPYKQWSF